MDEGDDDLGLPSKSQQVGLPRWITVGFTARTARRVQSPFDAGWPDAPENCRTDVDEAIRLAEQASRMGGADSGGAAGCASLAKKVIVSALEAKARVASEVARCASAAARAAQGTALYDEYPHNSEFVAAAFAEFAYESIVAAAESGVRSGFGVQVARTMRRDYALLVGLAYVEQWTASSRITTDGLAFGELWPDDEPRDWPARK